MRLLSWVLFITVVVTEAIKPSIDVRGGSELILKFSQDDVNAFVSRYQNQSLLKQGYVEAQLSELSFSLEDGLIQVQAQVNAKMTFLTHTNLEIPVSVELRPRIVNDGVEVEIGEIKISSNPLLNHVIGFIKSRFENIINLIVRDAIRQILPNNQLKPFLQSVAVRALQKEFDNYGQKEIDITPFIENMFGLLLDRIELNVLPSSIEFHIYFFHSGTPQTCLNKL